MGRERGGGREEKKGVGKEDEGRKGVRNRGKRDRVERWETNRGREGKGSGATKTF